jgi:hypothetical protein
MATAQTTTSRSKAISEAIRQLSIAVAQRSQRRELGVNCSISALSHESLLSRWLRPKEQLPDRTQSEAIPQLFIAVAQQRRELGVNNCSM